MLKGFVFCSLFISALGNSLSHRIESGIYTSRSGSKNEKPSQNSAPVGDDLSWWIILLITLSIVISIFIIVKCCVELQDLKFGRGKKICYLCLEHVKILDWKSGDHRRECAIRNSSNLGKMPQHQKAICPNCNLKMRLFPESSAPGFHCDSEGVAKSRNCLSQGKPVISNGKNRYNCFLCDFDLCEPCVVRGVELIEQSDCVSQKSHETLGSRNSVGRASRTYSKDLVQDHIEILRRASSKDLMNEYQRRKSQELQAQKNERRASHAGFIKSKSQSRRASDEKNVVETHRKPSKESNNYKNYHKRDTLAELKRRKSHADILSSSSMAARRPDLFSSPGSSRRYSQVEVRSYASNGGQPYKNPATGQLSKSPFTLGMKAKQTYSREQLISPRKKQLVPEEQLVTLIKQHNGADEQQQLLSSIKHEVLPEDQLSRKYSISVVESKERSEILQKKLLEAPRGSPPRAAAIKESEKLCSAEQSNATTLPILPTPSLRSARRPSLHPSETDPLMEERRRNSSTILVIKQEDGFTGKAPIIINKDDGLPRYPVDR